MTVHIESKKEEIAKKVLMPGDPLRAKYIAEHFLEDAKCINTTRNMLGYTGFYQGERITVFASGMGGPSIGIYAYELYLFYDVEEIIRIGTSGANKEEIKIKDLILAKDAYTLSSYPKLFFDDDEHLFTASKTLNEKIKKVSEEKNVSLKEGTIITSDIFDVYVDKERYHKNYPADLNAYANEMEGAILLCMAKHLNKQAACLLTIVDSPYSNAIITSEERETSLNDMIKLALDTFVIK